MQRIDRRTFLKGVAALIGAGVLAQVPGVQALTSPSAMVEEAGREFGKGLEISLKVNDEFTPAMEQIRKSLDTLSCCVCGAPAAHYVRDFRELPPVADADGGYWMCVEPASDWRYYCAKHYENGKIIRLDGQVEEQ
jgi:hypothetical protein